MTLIASEIVSSRQYTASAAAAMVDLALGFVLALFGVVSGATSDLGLTTRALHGIEGIAIHKCNYKPHARPSGSRASSNWKTVNTWNMNSN